MENKCHIKFFNPCAALQPYVRYYYVLTCGQRFSTLTFPLGCPQIIFHRGNPIYIPELDYYQSVFTISGQVNFPSHVQFEEATEMIVAVFYPHTIRHFITTPPSVFYNREISGFDLENRVLNQLYAKVIECENVEVCIDIIERYFMRKLADINDINLSRMGRSIALMVENKAITVSSLSDVCCLGRKQFERVFRNNIGMNPKEYAGIMRFQKSLWQMQCGNRSFTDIAYLAGYADQAHFNRDFKRFSGVTPTELLAMQEVYSDLFCRPI